MHKIFGNKLNVPFFNAKLKKKEQKNNLTKIKKK